MSRTPPTPRAALLLFVFSFLVLAALEGASRHFVQPTRLERVLSVLDRDPRLMWRMKRGLDTEFFGATLRTDDEGIRRAHASRPGEGKPPYRILTLGASPSLGWGVEDDQTYSARLESALNREAAAAPDARPVQVLNASVIGYSSHQGRLALEKNIGRWKPDTILIAFGINDVDSYRFMEDNGAPDTSVAAGTPWILEARNALDGFALVRLLDRFARTVPQSLARHPHALDPAAAERPARVSLPDFLLNIERMVELARGNGARAIILRMAVNLPAGPEPVDHAEAARKVQGARERIRAGDCAAALPELESAARLDPLSRAARIFLAECHRRLDRPELAREDEEAAYRIEARLASRRARAYNEALAVRARERGWELVDLEERFAREKEYLYLDPRSDTIHPNARGHQIIADELEKRILLPWHRKTAGSPLPND